MQESRCSDLIGHVLDPQSIVEDMTYEKVKLLLMELDMIMEDYEREIAIIYLSSNYSSKRHLCSSVLRGKHDHEIKEAVKNVRAYLVTEVERKKR